MWASTHSLLELIFQFGNTKYILPTDGANVHLPLFGHFCCRLAAQPYCLSHETHKGHLHIKVI